LAQVWPADVAGPSSRVPPDAARGLVAISTALAAPTSGGGGARQRG